MGFTFYSKFAFLKFKFSYNYFKILFLLCYLNFLIEF